MMYSAKLDTYEVHLGDKKIFDDFINQSYKFFIIHIVRDIYHLIIYLYIYIKDYIKSFFYIYIQPLIFYLYTCMCIS